MKTESCIIVFISLSALLIFMFFRQLLDNKKSWLLLLKIFAVLAVIGILGLGKSIMYLSFITPIYAVAIYRPLYILFKKGMHREPIDTAGNWTPDLFYDRLFNIVYVLLSIIPPFAIIWIYAITKNGA